MKPETNQPEDIDPTDERDQIEGQYSRALDEVAEHHGDAAYQAKADKIKSRLVAFDAPKSSLLSEETDHVPLSDIDEQLLASLIPVEKKGEHKAVSEEEAKSFLDRYHTLISKPAALDELAHDVLDLFAKWENMEEANKHIDVVQPHLNRLPGWDEKMQESIFSVLTIFAPEVMLDQPRAIEFLRHTDSSKFNQASNLVWHFQKELWMLESLLNRYKRIAQHLPEVDDPPPIVDKSE